jgi:YiiM-like, 3-alpha helix domain
MTRSVCSIETLDDITRLYRQDRYNLDLLRRVVEVEALPEAWRDYYLQRLVKIKETVS